MEPRASNPFRPQSSRPKSGWCGFTLTEMAIVLGVIGIIIGGIWVAVSAARYRIEINQGSDEINMIAGNMRSLYSGQNASAIPTTPVSAAFEQQLVTQGVFPSEMVSGGFAYNPWDRSNANGSAQIALQAKGGNNTSEFDLKYLKIPVNVCADLLVHNSTPGNDTGLVQIQVNSVAVPGGLPVTPVKAAGVCPAAGTVTIDWYYTLGS